MASIKCENPELVVKKAFYLAWVACGGPVGMGFLQNNPGADIDSVWNNVQSAGDYPGGASLHRQEKGSAYGDYVFGRMMKLGLNWNEDSVTFTDAQPRPDYQAWCRKYKTYKDLVEAAIRA
jgi:hypothetical protein